MSGVRVSKWGVSGIVVPGAILLAIWLICVFHVIVTGDFTKA